MHLTFRYAGNVMQCTFTIDLKAKPSPYRFISLTIFLHNSNLMEIQFFSHLNWSLWLFKYNKWGVMCKNCSNVIASNGLTVKRNINRIWITTEESSVKWAPWLAFGIVRATLTPDTRALRGYDNITLKVLKMLRFTLKRHNSSSMTSVQSSHVMTR